MKNTKRNRLPLQLFMLLMCMLTLFSVVSVSAFADDSAGQEIPGEVVFGSYPQSKVTDDTLIATLNQKAGDPDLWESYDLPERTYFKYVGDFESGGSYGVFTTATDYMKKIDITIDGEKYRGVYFTLYIYDTTLYENYGYQKDNGYLKNTVYWFKYEPLHWRSYYKNTYQCTTLIDARELGKDVVDVLNKPYLEYEGSVPLKTWLNGEFIDTAFTDYEQSKLVASDDVYKLKVNLPGAYNGLYSKVTEPKDCKGTDYAKCMGLRIVDGEGCYWKLTSPIDSQNVTTGPDNEVMSGYSTCVGVCPRITLSDSYDVCISENQIMLGSYPQELVTDTALISILNGKAPAQSSWTVYPYYKNGSKTSDMKYCDITYNNVKYRGVYIKDYRPIRTDRKSDSHNQEAYGYKKGNTYWFEYKPVKWNKMNDSDVYICDSILDSQAYNDIDDGYDYIVSDIRDWLNSDFRMTVFNATELSNLKRKNIYCERLQKSVDDYIFLVSKADYSENYTVSDQPFTTDYAFSQGLGKFSEGYFWWKNGSTSKHISGQHFGGINCVITLTVEGDKRTSDIFFVTGTEVGVRPAIMLKSSDTDDIVTCTHSQLSNWLVDKAATCTTYGRNIKVCQTCGKEMQSVVTIGAHNFNGTVTNPNGDGTHCRVCSVCNKAYGGTKIACSGGTATCSSKAKCASCGGEYGSYGSHNFTYWKSNNDATCLKNGTCTLKCDYCSVTTVKTELCTRKEHSYTGAYTSNGNGYHSRLCVNGCGLADTESLVKCSGGVSSCTEEATCSVCGGKYGPTGHSFKTMTTYQEATCLSDKKVQGKCTKCNNFVISTVSGTKLSHSYTGTRMLPNGDGTHSKMCVNGCKKPGGTKYVCSGGTATCVTRAICSVCGGEYGDFNDDHSFGNAEIITPATCMQEGVQRLICTRSGCSVTKTETVSKVSHDFSGDYVSSGDGSTHCRKCKYGCGNVGGTKENCSGGTATCQVKAICEICSSPYGEKGNHLYTSYKPKTAATCLKAGTKSRYCHYCGKTQTGTNKDDPIKAHDYSGDWVSNGDGTHSQLCVNGCGLPNPEVKVNCSGGTATCDNKAVCTVCKTPYGDCAHTFGAYQYNNDATCLTAGTKTRLCSSCLLIETVTDETHPKLSHSYINKVDAKYLKSVANCVSPAVYYVSCSFCGKMGTDTFNSGEKDKNNHTALSSDGDCYGCGMMAEHTQEQYSDNCSCSCHKSGFSGFIWKILCFFYKLFNVSSKRYCACGKAHW